MSLEVTGFENVNSQVEDINNIILNINKLPTLIKIGLAYELQI